MVTDKTFEARVLRDGPPVLVAFWTEWCVPCQRMKGVLEQVAEALGDRLTVAKLDADQSPATPFRYGVRGVPTLMLFRDGQVAATRVGGGPKVEIMAWLTEAGVAA